MDAASLFLHAETVLQIVKFYTIVKKIFKQTFRTAVLVRVTKDYRTKRQFKNSFHYTL